MTLYNPGIRRVLHEQKIVPFIEKYRRLNRAYEHVVLQVPKSIASSPTTEFVFRFAPVNIIPWLAHVWTRPL
jgi:hypothetical protein